MKFVTDGKSLTIGSVFFARTFAQRAMGLMIQKPIGAGHGLLLTPCAAIHTFFMRYSLDLIFITRAEVVTRVVADVPPWRLATGGHRAWGVLELQSGWFPCSELIPGKSRLLIL